MMKNVFQIRALVFFVIALASPWSMAQSTLQNSSTSRTLAPLGTEKCISISTQGKIQYFDQRVPQDKVEIDVPAVSFVFEFTQNGSSNGVIRAILASNISLGEAALELAIDGDLNVTLADYFTQSKRNESAYKNMVED